MPYSTLNWAWEVDGLKTMQKFLLIALADMADEAHSCFPGQSTLARMTASSERAVRENLGKLEEAGYIVRVRRHRDNGSRTSDRFILQVGFQAADSAGGDQLDLPADSDRTYRQILPNLPADSAGVEEPPEEPPVEHPDTRSSFDDFWAAYPRHVARPKAAASFAKAVKGGTDPGMIVAGAVRLARDPNLPELQFVPHPATWLNQGRWDDDPLPPRERPQGSTSRPAGDVEEWMYR